MTQAPIGTMSPDRSATGMNSAGLTVPSSGWSQRRRASQPTGRPCAEGHDRLVDEAQLVALEGPAQRGVEIEAAGDLAAQRVAEHLDPGPAPLLGQVHGRVGVAQQARPGCSPDG